MVGDGRECLQSLSRKDLGSFNTCEIQYELSSVTTLRVTNIGYHLRLPEYFRHIARHLTYVKEFNLLSYPVE